jgi:hypothetical protein
LPASPRRMSLPPRAKVKSSAKAAVHDVCSVAHHQCVVEFGTVEVLDL